MGQAARAGTPVILSAANDFDFGSGEYRELLLSSNATAFQHPDWLEPFYRILVPANGVEPLMVTGRDRASGRLDLVLPLVRSATSIDYAFLDVTDYACPVMRSGVQVVDTLPAELRAVTGGRALRIAPVRHEHVAQWRTLLNEQPDQLPFSAHSMHVPLHGTAHGRANFSARRRNDLARKARRLGPLEMHILHDDAIAEALLEAQMLRRNRFENDPLQLQHGLQFYCEVATRGDLSGLSRTFRLSHEGRSVAILFGLADGSRFRYILLACDYARYSRFSPGLLIFERTIAHWAQAGGDVFDFTIGDEPYKAELGCAKSPMFAFVTA